MPQSWLPIWTLADQSPSWPLTVLTSTLQCILDRTSAFMSDGAHCPPFSLPCFAAPVATIRNYGAAALFMIVKHYFDPAALDLPFSPSVTLYTLLKERGCRFVDLEDQGYVIRLFLLLVFAILFGMQALESLAKVLRALLASSVNLEDVCYLARRLPLAARLERVFLSELDRKVPCAAGMSGVGRLFTCGRIGETGIVFVDSDEALSDPTLTDADRDILRMALASTFGGKLRGSAGDQPASVVDADDESDEEYENPLMATRTTTLRAIAHTKAYIWRCIDRARKAAEEAGITGYSVLVHRPAEVRQYSLPVSGFCGVLMLSTESQVAIVNKRAEPQPAMMKERFLCSVKSGNVYPNLGFGKSWFWWIMGFEAIPYKPLGLPDYQWLDIALGFWGGGQKM